MESGARLMRTPTPTQSNQSHQSKSRCQASHAIKGGNSVEWYLAWQSWLQRDFPIGFTGAVHCCGRYWLRWHRCQICIFFASTFLVARWEIMRITVKLALVVALTLAVPRSGCIARSPKWGAKTTDFVGGITSAGAPTNANKIDNPSQMQPRRKKCNYQGQCNC